MKCLKPAATTGRAFASCRAEGPGAQRCSSWVSSPARASPKPAHAARVLVCHSARSDSNSEAQAPPARSSGPGAVSQNAALRGEAEAPFRVVRIAGYAALAVSAGIGGAIAAIRVFAGFVKGDIVLSQALASEDVTGLGIDVAAFATLAYLFNIERSAQAKQLARLQREENLASLKVEIKVAKPRLVTLEQLQGFARVVVVAGSREYLEQALGEAAELTEMLKERNVCIVPVLMQDGEQLSNILEGTLSDPKVVLTPILLAQWRSWITDQMQEAGVMNQSAGVFVGLRMDGRVRASGTFLPPWRRFIAELAPKDGIWGSKFMGGFDGRV